MNDEIDIDLKSLQVYYSRREKDLAICFVALQMKDFVTIARIGHKLKGNGVTFGFPEISKLGASLEDAAGGQRLSELQMLVTEFKTWIDTNSHLAITSI